MHFYFTHNCFADIQLISFVQSNFRWGWGVKVVNMDFV